MKKFIVLSLFAATIFASCGTPFKLSTEPFPNADTLQFSGKDYKYKLYYPDTLYKKVQKKFNKYTHGG